MARKRVAIGTFLVATIAAFAVGPFAATGGAKIVGTGQTSASIQLSEITLSSVPELGDLNASLGRISSDATTIGDTHARVLIEALGVAGQSIGAEVSSSDGTVSKDATFPISAAGVDGSITVAELRAEADARSARAILSALAGKVNVGPLAIAARVGDNGVRSEVVRELATSRSGASFGPVKIGVADLVSEDLLGALPLSALIDLADAVNVRLPIGVREQVRALRHLISSLDDVQAAIEQLKDAQAALEKLVAENSTLAAQIDAARDAVAAAQAEVDRLEAEIAALEAQIAALEAEIAALEAEIAALEAEIAAMEAEITNLEAEKAELEALLAACGGIPLVCDPLQAELDAVVAELSILQGELSAARQQLAALKAELDAARTELEATRTELEATRTELEAALDTLAAAQAELVALLSTEVGKAIDAAQKLVDDLQAQVDSLLSTIEDLLGKLDDLQGLRNDLLALLSDAPVVEVGRISVVVSTSADGRKGTARVDCGATGIVVAGQAVGGQTCAALAQAFAGVRNTIRGVLDSLPVAGAIPNVTVEGLQETTSASGSPDAAGRTSASAALSPLHLGIPSVSLAAVTDELLVDLLDTIAEAEGSLPTGGTISTLLADLKSQIDALPTGEALQGARTMGVDMVLAGFTSQSSFDGSDGGAVSQPPPSVDTPDERPPTEPTYGEPGEPIQAAPMPFTGSSSSLVLALALWLIAAGSLVMFFADHEVIVRVIAKATRP